MRKFFYSFVVLATFGLYALHQQSENAVPVVVPPPGVLPPVASNEAQQTPPSPATPPAKIKTPPVISPSPTPQPRGQYNDGQYTGPAADAYYGNIQVRVNISGGKITDVTFLQYPNDRSTSVYINSQAMPYLRQEAIQAQSANVQIVSGATDSSMAFQQSLAGALAQAKG